MNTFVRRSIIGVAAAGLTVAALAAPAAAAGNATLSMRATGSVGPDSPPPMAGYDLTPGGVIHQGSVRFKVPHVNCPTQDTQGIALGLGVEATSGSPTTLGDVFVACLGGAPYYQLDALANGVPASDSTNVAAGDKITATYKVQGGTLKVTVQDATSGTTVTASGSAPNDMTLAMGSFPLFAGSADPLEAPDFHKATLTKIHINNNTATSSIATANNGNPQITVGPFQNSGKFKLMI